MSPIILTYLILPFALSWLVIKFLKTYSKNEAPQDIRDLYAHKPLPRGVFRVVKRSHGQATILEDCPSHEDAVEKAYLAMRRSKAAGEQASFLVLNHAGAAFEQIDS